MTAEQMMGGRRTGRDRRMNDFPIPFSDRRSGMDRRKGTERRNGFDRRNPAGFRRKVGMDRRKNFRAKNQSSYP